MPATMEILGWKSEGMRCPDHEVDFLDNRGSVYRVTLLQMPNGTGKTTTLRLLRAALSGEAAQWPAADVMEFKKEGGAATSGHFEIRLMLNGRRTTVVMNFDFDSGAVHYLTTIGSGQSNGFHPPRELQPFMKPAFVNFFVFDGELAEQLLDARHVRAEDVIEGLFQTGVLRIIGKKVSEHWTLMTHNRGALSEQGLTLRRNKLDKISRRLEVIVQEQATLSAEQRRLKGRLRQKQAAYEKEIRSVDERGDRLTLLQTEVKNRSAAVDADALAVLESMRNPHALSDILADKMRALKNGLDRVKLPESVAREFFLELAEEDLCVCARPVDDAIRTVILGRSRQYLGSTDVALLNAIKSDIHNALGESDGAAAAQLDTAITQLGTSVDEHRDAKNALDLLQLEAEDTDPAVKDAKDEIEGIKTRLRDVENELQKYDSKDDQGDESRLYGIEVLTKRKKRAENEYAEVTETIELKYKRDTLAGIIADAHAKARQGIIEDVCESANERIRTLMPYNAISIAGIDKCLQLEGKAGGSVGENLSIAYAFLASLFYRAEQKLPFVVDSPAGSIDLDIRTRLGELIPQLTGQFIAFTISTERAAFVPKLKSSCDGEIQFLTLFRKGRQVAVDAMARNDYEHSETDDGLVVASEQFFNDFQVEQDEEAGS